jgi:DNA-binding CsgD family transcriptional regulator
MDDGGVDRRRAGPSSVDALADLTRSGRDRDRFVGRAQECRRLDELLLALRAGQSETLVVEGLPGIGKTELLRHAMARAGDLRVVHAQGVETDAALPFTTLAALLSPFADRVRDLPGPQQAALAAVLGPSAADTCDRLTVGTATLGCLSRAAEDGPILVVVDDGQWVDPSSGEALLFACRRLAHEGVGVLIALREGEAGPFAGAGFATLHLGGLGRDEARSLVDLDTVPDVAERIVAATGGHPLAIIELGRLLSEKQRAGSEPLPDPLPAGRWIEDAFAQRIARLSDGARQLLVVASVDAGLDVAVLLGASRRFGIPSAALDEVVAAGLVEVCESRLHFSHPVLRSVVYHRAPEELRRESHGVLAAMLRRQSDLDRRAWHLAAAADGPDEGAAAALDRAAESAQERGAFAEAGAALERAATLSSSDDDRARRLIAAGDAFWRGGQSAHALSTFRDALKFTADPLQRADIRLRTGVPEALSQAMPSTRELRDAAREIRPFDPVRAAVLLAQASLATLNASGVDDAVAIAEEAVALTPPGSSPGHLAASLALALTHLAQGEQSRALQELDDFVALIDGVGMRHEWFGVAEYIANALMWAERFVDAQRLLDAMIAFARDRSAPGLLPFALTVRAELAFFTGSWMNAFTDAWSAANLARESQQVAVLPYPLITLARAASALGREQEARLNLKSARELAARAGNRSLEYWAHATMGFVELGAGRLEAAGVQLELTAQAMDEQGVWHPSTLTWRGDLVEACARLGRRGSGARALERLEALADRTGGVWALAAAQRARGMLADGDWEHEFLDSILALRGLPLPFERARSQLCFGERLRREHRGPDATVQLRAAREEFARLGAGPWVARADSELAASGERPDAAPPSGLARLTAQELQVATAVAAGRTNAEAAEQLYLSRRTVEHHLGNIYRKLGIHSRMHLVRWLSPHSD